MIIKNIRIFNKESIESSGCKVLNSDTSLKQILTKAPIVKDSNTVIGFITKVAIRDGSAIGHVYISDQYREYGESLCFESQEVSFRNSGIKRGVYITNYALHIK